MNLYTKLPEDIKEVDVIIAGGGTTGCVVASRLADADPELSILVIEGGSNNNIPTVSHPAFFVTHVMPGSTTSIFYQGNKSKALSDRVPIVPSGGILGGGSSTNFLMYSRGQRSDYDSWNTPGWSADELLPYMKKLETYHGLGPKDLHGFDGPIHVSGGIFRSSKLEDDFIQAAGKAGWPEIVDLQTLDDNNGVQRALRYVSLDGKRQDAASRYLCPRLEDNKHPNLHVLLETQVARILFNNSKAVGVEYQSNPTFHPATNDTIRQVKARKMVVVSCGACGTPSVLERSGVGSPEILKKAGVPIVADVPGVGHEYQDHNNINYAYKSILAPEDTLDALAAGRMDVGELLQNNDKILSWNGMDGFGKLRPTDADVVTLGSDFQEAWDRDYKDKPDRPMAIISLVAAYTGDPTSVPVGQYFSTALFTVYPYSRGHLHITGPALGDPLDFETGFFTNELDVKKHMWAYKAQREVARRMKTYRGEVTLTHPPFAADSAAACIEIDHPLPDDVAPIVYSAEDDAVLEQYLRENITTTWHSLGTCKMAPRERMGVVDARLSVYGVVGLKIADLSIVPSNVAANTNNTALMIGEKAADLILEDLGLLA